MLLDPSGRALGMDAMLPYFQVLPFADVLFRDLTFSGWALLIVNGLSNLTAACLLLAKKKAGVVLGGTAIASLFTTRSAVSFLVFTLLYTPCVAAVATIRRELNSTLKTALVVLIALSAFFSASECVTPSRTR